MTRTSGVAGAIPSLPGTALLAAVSCAVFELVGGVLLVALVGAGLMDDSVWVLVPAALVVVLAATSIAGVMVESRLSVLDWRSPGSRAVLAIAIVVAVQALFLAVGGWRSDWLGNASGFVVTVFGAWAGVRLVHRRADSIR